MGNAVRKPESKTIFEGVLEVEFERYLKENMTDEMGRKMRYRERAAELFIQWFGRYPYHFEEAELVTGVNSRTQSQLIVHREIRLLFHEVNGYEHFKIVNTCGGCGKLMVDENSWITNLRDLAVEVHKEGRWFCARCD